MSSVGRIEGVGTVHEFVEKAIYSNPAYPKPASQGIGQAEPAGSSNEFVGKSIRSEAAVGKPNPSSESAAGE
jgi:hypothetical protein